MKWLHCGCYSTIKKARRKAKRSNMSNRPSQEYEADSPDYEGEPANIGRADASDILAPGDGIEADTLLTPTRRLILFGLLIAAALSFFIFQGLSNSSVYYLTVSELEAKGPTEEGKLVRVAGKLVDNSFNRDSENEMDVTFAITDETGNNLSVAYTGVVGQLFFNDYSELILEGAYGENGVFDVEQLVVKCPSKYVDVQDEAGENVTPDYSDPDITTETYTSSSGA